NPALLMIIYKPENSHNKYIAKSTVVVVSQRRHPQHPREKLLDRALQNPDIKHYFNVDKLNEYRGFGGVRIEDDVIILAAGNECMNQVPRTVEEIEAFMAGK
uniref:FAD-dependent oxidoreductase n=1 Tax=Bursaphelenchus xylophilus TaxID=6326 RepID=A0A1I7SNY3_BURXY